MSKFRLFYQPRAKGVGSGAVLFCLSFKQLKKRKLIHFKHVLKNAISVKDKTQRRDPRAHLSTDKTKSRSGLLGTFPTLSVGYLI